MVYEIRDVIYLTHFDLQKGFQSTDLISPEFQRIYAMDYWHEDTLLFSAATDGFSDLYKYSLRTRQTFPVTNDFFDDIDIRKYSHEGKEGILFSSNRTDTLYSERGLDTLLPLENFDIFFMWPCDGGWSIRNLTRTPLASERQPIPAGDDAIAMLSGETGQQVRKVMSLHTGQFTRLNDSRLVTHHIGTGRASQAYVAFVADGLQRLSLVESIPRDELQKWSAEPPQRAEKQPVGTKDAMDVADPKYLFQSEFTRPKDIPTVREQVKVDQVPVQVITPVQPEQIPGEPVNFDPSQVIEFRPVRAIAHRLRFRLDYVTTTMDNSLLFTSLDAYAGTKPQYENPPLGILLKANLKDLFEDYVIEGGARFPTSFNGSEYFLYLDDLKKRIDRRYAFYRKSLTESMTNGPLAVDRTQTVTVIGPDGHLFEYPDHGDHPE
jgi:hypothetical protein